MTPGERAHLSQLCRIFGIPEGATEPNPELAYNVLLRMYLVPTIESQAERRRALNDARGNLTGHFDPYSVFVGKTAQITAQMQQTPDWWNHLNRPTEELVDSYLSLGLAIQALKLAGLGAGSGAAAAGATEAVKTGSVNAGIRRAGERAIGKGGLLDETIKKLTRGGRLSTPAGLAVTIGGTVLYTSAVDKQAHIREILHDRYQKGEMSDDDFRKVFGDQFDPSRMKKYWE